MRTNIIIDDELMAEALEASGLKTKHDVVEQALRLLIQVRRQALVRELKGEITWRGDLDDLRGSARMD